MRKILKPLKENKRITSFTLFSTIVVTLFTVWTVHEALKAEVVFAADGEEQTVKTNNETVGELLEELGINVEEDDQLSHSIDAKIIDGMEINFEKAYTITMEIDGKVSEYVTTAATIGQFLDEAGFDFTKYDKVSASKIEFINKNRKIDVEKAFQVKLTDGDQKAKKIWTTAMTVEQFLEENEIEMSKHDKVKPELDEELDSESKVKITRIEKETEESEEEISFKTEEKTDSSLEKGKSYIDQEGKKGKVLKTYEVTYKNGEESDREVIEEKVLKESKKQIIIVGTKPKPKPNKYEKGKTYVMEATGYGPDCKGCSGTSAAGLNLKAQPTPKVIAVDPRVIPLGSKVWVEGYGEAVAGDTGGAIKGNRIDVLLPSESYAASNWGRRTVQVKVLN